MSSYFDGGHLDISVHLMEDLSYGHVIHGPAIIIDKNSTILVEPDCKAEMTKKGDVTIMIGKGKSKHIGKELDAIQLSIFSHRLRSLVLSIYSGTSLIRTPNNRNPRYPTQNCRERISSYAFYPFNPETPLSDYPDIRSSSRTSMQLLHWRRRGFEEDSLLKQLYAVSVVY
ncbi:5-oxoprolinase-like [Clavelina lepadiformis]|uniref:5-oxoprolinase-like n=1 Tax=Clavelina lepadiformis TaxID=159417 RepID=UPI004042BEDF